MKKGEMKGPLYSSGTSEGTKNTQGKVHGPKGVKSVPDPLGYRKKGQ